MCATNSLSNVPQGIVRYASKIDHRTTALFWVRRSSSTEAVLRHSVLPGRMLCSDHFGHNRLLKVKDESPPFRSALWFSSSSSLGMLHLPWQYDSYRGISAVSSLDWSSVPKRASVSAAFCLSSKLCAADLLVCCSIRARRSTLEASVSPSY